MVGPGARRQVCECICRTVTCSHDPSTHASTHRKEASTPDKAGLAHPGDQTAPMRRGSCPPRTGPPRAAATPPAPSAAAAGPVPAYNPVHVIGYEAEGEGSALCLRSGCLSKIIVCPRDGFLACACTMCLLLYLTASSACARSSTRSIPCFPHSARTGSAAAGSSSRIATSSRARVTATYASLSTEANTL